MPDLLRPLIARLAGLVLLMAAVPAQPWGHQGHRVSAQLAAPLLSAETRAAIRRILGEQDLASAAIWADKMRSNPSPFWRKQARFYHYVTVPPGRHYEDVEAPPQGDAITALTEFRRILADPAAPLVRQQLALRFSIHIVQDLHQPLHVGNGRDRGGTRFRVHMDGRKYSFHWLWDSGLFKQSPRSDAVLKQHLEKAMDKPYIKAWSQAYPLLWVGESAQLRERIYPIDKTVDKRYVDTWLPVAEEQLRRSAVRTAAYLNAILGG